MEKGFIKHGVILTDSGGDQKVGQCPFCGKDEHFYVNIKNGLWDCKECGLTGNYNTFLKLISDKNQKLLKGRALLELVKSRNIDAGTLKSWGVGWNGRFYTIPVYSGHSKKALSDLRIYRLNKAVISSPGVKLGLFGLDRFKDEYEIIYLLEGEWDSMVMDRVVKELHIKANILGAPGAGVFKDKWPLIFENKTVIICYDNDEAGNKGRERVYNMISGVAKEIKHIEWPSALATGFDIRDLWVSVNDIKKFYGSLNKLIENYKPPDTGEPGTGEKIEITGKGLNHKKVIERYREWLYLPDPEPLYIIYGTILANRLEGDPIWMFLVAPSGGTKSELLLSLGKAPFIRTVTSLTPHALISGATFTAGKDPSLIPKLDKKVLVIKDFTAILSMHPTGRDEIFGVLRDAYDGKIEKTYGTGVTRSYESRFGLLAGTTPAIELFNTVHATLGERFMKYRIKFRKGAEEDLIKKALSNVSHEKKMRKELNEVAFQTLNREVNYVPKISPEIINKIRDLARWTAGLRGSVSREKYTGEIQYMPTIEIATRIAKQMAKMSMGITIFKGEGQVSLKTFKIIIHIARDTIPDRVNEIVRAMYLNCPEGEYLGTGEISGYAGFPSSTASKLLYDLELLKVVTREGGGARGSWQLTRKIYGFTKDLGIYDE